MTTTQTEIIVSMESPKPRTLLQLSRPTKYPHTRALLDSLLSEYRSNLLAPPSPNPEDGSDAEDVRAHDPELLAKVVAYLQEEKEEELKALLKNALGIVDDSLNAQLEQHVLDLMHKHRDDLSNVPFVYLTPTKRPISRPSSRASSHSFRLPRPDTPTSTASSPRALSFRRPHTPVISPLMSALHANASSYISSVSPASSPTLPHAGVANLATSSPNSSPLSSPRFLNAKATEFRPSTRPTSSASNPGSFPRDPSPDLWSHNLSNTFSTAPGRGPSNLAIASPLVANPYFTHVVTPISSLTRSSSRPSLDDEDDEFSPFSKARTIPRSFHASDPEKEWSSSNSTSSPSNSFDTTASHSEDDPTSYPYPQHLSGHFAMEEYEDEDDQAVFADGMTPFDVLSSVFGATLSPAELEDALVQNGFDFENTMAWLVDKAMPQAPPSLTAPVPRPYAAGAKVMVAPRDSYVRAGRGGQPVQVVSTNGRSSPRYGPGTRNQQGPNRVCRYFLAGECMRADCRFSHDIERAMCRFWLRGTCAKTDSCEFLHHLPKEVDISPLTEAVARASLDPSSVNGNNIATTLSEDFPVLGRNDLYGKARPSGYAGQPSNAYQNSNNRTYDPSRTRFAAAVKSIHPPNALLQSQPITGARFTSFSHAGRPGVEGPQGNGYRNGPPIPRPSPRIKLRVPSLLPTLPTGESLNSLYMSYRQRALQLGAARNACLARAADAWRRGDGAAAKRFSREAHDLNGKMGGEAADAAAKLVRERARLAMDAVRHRDPAWTDDPGDRTERGKPCGGGLGVCLGVARIGITGEGSRLTPEERTEALLDLHGLHSTEAVDCMSEFLLALEREHFFGLAYLVVGEEKHTGTQDPLRGASRARLGVAVRECLHRYGYPWSERNGIICVDPLTHV